MDIINNFKGAESNMAHFRIPVIPPTCNKTIRFPVDVIEDVEYLIRGKQCTFSALVIEAVRTAIISASETASTEDAP